MKKTTIYARKYRQKASESLKKKWRGASLKYYYNNKEKIKLSCLRRKDKIIKASRKYYLKNKERIKEFHKKYYLKNKKEILKRNQEYRKTHIDIFIKALKKYRKNHYFQELFRSIKYRCRYKKIKFQLEKTSFFNWYIKQKKICVYCKITESGWNKKKDTLAKRFKKLQIDRKNNNLGYILDNIVLACPRCNIIKSDFFNFKQMKKIGRIVNASHKHK